MLAWLALLATAPVHIGCISPTPPRSMDTAALRTLEGSLRSVPGMGESQARTIAIAALDTTADLHAEYRPPRWPKLGNLAYHTGLRDKALCCHWARDLLHSLSALEVQGVEMHWGVAHHGNVLREHSAVVVVPDGARFEEGLVLDAWRDAGHLYFGPVSSDRYPWKPHPSDANRLLIECSSGS